jgi:hypothetical protein
MSGFKERLRAGVESPQQQASFLPLISKASSLPLHRQASSASQHSLDVEHGSGGLDATRQLAAVQRNYESLSRVVSTKQRELDKVNSAPKPAPRGLRKWQC